MFITVTAFALGFCWCYCTGILFAQIYYDRIYLPMLIVCILSGYGMAYKVQDWYKQAVEIAVRQRLEEIVKEETEYMNSTTDALPGDEIWSKK